MHSGGTPQKVLLWVIISGLLPSLVLALAAQDSTSIIGQALQNTESVAQFGSAMYVLQVVVPANKTLVLRGAGQSTVLRVGPDGIVLKPGARLIVSNLTIDISDALPPISLPEGLEAPWPVPFVVTDSSSTTNLKAVQFRGVTVQLQQCGMLAVYQELICSYAATAQSGAHLWGLPQVRPGSVYFRAPSPDARFDALSDVLLTCNGPSTSGINDSFGIDVPSMTTPPEIADVFESSSSIHAAWSMTTCRIQPVADSTQLLQVLSAMSHTVNTLPEFIVVVQLMANISLSMSSWPLQGVHIQTAVMLVGLPSSMHGIKFQGLELDLANVPRFVDVHQQLGSLSVVDLCLTNMAFGSDTYFPMSLLVGALWAVHFDRPSSNRTMLLLKNTQLVVPPDLFTYLSYWAAIQSSNVPSVRVAADWLRNNVYFGLTVGDADEHTLHYISREGQGTLWINSTLTDKSYHAPLTMEQTGIGQLVPQVTPVFNTSQLMSLLRAPPTPYLVLLNNTNLNPTITAALAVSDPAPSASCSQPVRLIGRPNLGSVILDLGGAASLLSLAMPQGGRLMLQRVIVTGLGPASNTSSNSTSQLVLNNLTSLMWAFDFARKQPMLRLSNVTLVVSDAELRVMKQALVHTTQTQSATSDLGVLHIVQSTWALSNVVFANDTALVLSDVATSGIEGTQVILSSIVPKRKHCHSPTFQVTPAVSLQLHTASTTAPAATRRITSALPQWLVGAMVTVCCVVLLGPVLLLWIWLHGMRQLRQAVDDERAAKMAALEQVQELSSIVRRTPSEPGQKASHSNLKQYHRQHFMFDVRRSSAPAASSVRHADSLPPRQRKMILGKGDVTLLALSEPIGQPGAEVVRRRLAVSLDGKLGRNSSMRHALRSNQSGVLSRNSAPQELPSGADNDNSSPGKAGQQEQEQADALWAGHERGLKQSTSSARGAARDGVQFTRSTSDKHASGSSMPIRGANPGSTTPEPRGPSMIALLMADSLISQPSKGVTVLMADSSKAGTNKEETGRTAASNGSTTPRAALLVAGLAAGDDAQAPSDVLQQVIKQRKEMQGIDLQQVEFQQVLGQGSFGVVYKGRWKSLTVAIKTLMFQDVGEAKRVRQRAITEAAINTLLTDDHIVNTYAHDLRAIGGSGMPDDKHAIHWKLYIIQEYCDGGSLAQAIDKGLLVDSLTNWNNMMMILQIALDIAKGMEYIHGANVIHGDLSSANVMLRHEQRLTCCFRAKVGDFGLSRFLEGPDHSHISNARQGTPFYMAPELMNEGIISKDTDVFSFGVLLWEMFCGMPPWRNPDQSTFRQTCKPQTFPYHVPHNCPSEYHQIIIACLAEDPKARPKFSEVVRHIANLLQMLVDSRMRRRPGPSPYDTATAPPVTSNPAIMADAPASLAYVDPRLRGAAAIAAAEAAAAAAAIAAPSGSEPVCEAMEEWPRLAVSSLTAAAAAAWVGEHVASPRRDGDEFMMAMPTGSPDKRLPQAMHAPFRDDSATAYALGPFFQTGFMGAVPAVDGVSSGITCRPVAPSSVPSLPQAIPISRSDTHQLLSSGDESPHGAGQMQQAMGVMPLTGWQAGMDSTSSMSPPLPIWSHESHLAHALLNMAHATVSANGFELQDASVDNDGNEIDGVNGAVGPWRPLSLDEFPSKPATEAVGMVPNTWPRTKMMSTTVAAPAAMVAATNVLPALHVGDKTASS